MEYAKRYELPQFPDKEPQEGRRLIVGLEQGSVFDKAFKGFSKWIGGGGVGKVPPMTPLADALRELHADVARRLEEYANEAQARARYYEELGGRWQTNPEQFAVTPAVTSNSVPHSRR